MKIELHAHTLPVSPCARYTADVVTARYEALGYDAIVLTNHYSEYSYPYLGGTHRERIKAYLAAYRAAKSVSNIPVFLGVEAAIQGPRSRAEFLLYGIDEAFLSDSPPLIELTQRELFERVEACGGVMIQAHPFRSEFGMCPQNPTYMHGVEVNCHPHHLRAEEAVDAFAKKHRLLVTAGSDYHGEADPVAGILTDGDLADNRALADVLRAGAYRYFYEKTARAGGQYVR